MLEVGVVVKVSVDTSQSKTHPQLTNVDVRLNLPDYLDPSAYYENGRLTSAGVIVVTSILTQGLIANIHGAHQYKLRDSAEHLRYIISELERGFVAQVKVE